MPDGDRLLEEVIPDILRRLRYLEQLERRDVPGLADHDHTGAGDGGVLTGDVHDGFSEYAEIVAPANPAADSTRLYTRDDAGTSKMYYRRSDGTEIELGGGGGGDADTVDGYHASNVPSPLTLLALNAAAEFPDNVVNFNALTLAAQVYAAYWRNANAVTFTDNDTDWDNDTQSTPVTVRRRSTVVVVGDIAWVNPTGRANNWEMRWDLDGTGGGDSGNIGNTAGTVEHHIVLGFWADVSAGDKTLTLQVHKTQVAQQNDDVTVYIRHVVAFVLPIDDALLYTGGWQFDPGAGDVSVWNRSASDGVEAWSIDHGDTVYAVAIGPDRNIYVAGGDGSGDSVRCLDPTGAELWAENWGDAVRGIAVDGLSNIYIAEDSGDVSKYDAARVLQWTDNHGGVLIGVAVDALGNVAVVGQEVSNVTTRYYDKDGVEQWNANHDSTCRAVAFDAAGNVFTVGDVTTNGGDVTTRKYDNAGNLLATANHARACYSVAIGPDGTVYVGGRPTADANTYSLRKYDNDLNLIWSVATGGYVKGLAVDAAGNAYTASDDGTWSTQKYDKDGALIWQVGQIGVDDDGVVAAAVLSL